MPHKNPLQTQADPGDPWDLVPASRGAEARGSFDF
jgi:hypothetical protein